MRQRDKHYDRWHNMMARCYRPNHPTYPHYGGRGISVDLSWHDSRVFRAWAEKTYQPGLWLERRNNNEGYTPDNCCWATREQQMLNRRRDTHAQLAHIKRMHKELEKKLRAVHGDPATRKTQVCPVCRVRKRKSAFARSLGATSGRASYCRECMKIYKSRRKR